MYILYQTTQYLYSMYGENALRLMHDIRCRYEPRFRQMIYIEL